MSVHGYVIKLVTTEASGVCFSGDPLSCIRCNSDLFASRMEEACIYPFCIICCWSRITLWGADSLYCFVLVSEWLVLFTQVSHKLSKKSRVKNKEVLRPAVSGYTCVRLVDTAMGGVENRGNVKWGPKSVKCSPKIHYATIQDFGTLGGIQLWEPQENKILWTAIQWSGHYFSSLYAFRDN